MHLRKDKIPFSIYLICFFALLFLMTCFSIYAGFINIPYLDVVNTLIGNGDASNELTIFSFRLPRIVMSILVGIGIAGAGALLQGLSKNPLADPGILGINAGAGFMVVLYIFFIQGQGFYQSVISVYLMPIIALVGAFSAALIIYLLAWKKGSVSPTRMILVGIGVNAGFVAGITIIQMKMDPVDFTKTLVWISGTIWGSTWTYVIALLPWLVILIPIIIYKSRVLDLLALGEENAIAVGIDLTKERIKLLVVAVALAGACVAVGGGITFVGLIAPHIARKLVGARHLRSLPIALCIGGLLVLIADTLARVVFGPMEVPVGIILAIIGTPYFIYLILFKKE